MPRIQLHRLMILLFAPLLLLSGCAVDSAGPESVTLPEEASLALAASEVQIFNSKNDPRLLSRLESEKRRLDRDLKASQHAYDSLKVVWGQLSTVDKKLRSKFLYCDPIQYVATVKIVGPDGDNLDFGPHKLTIPRGALQGYTVVTAVAPVGLVVQATFAPHGLQFLKPTQLSLSYKHCILPKAFGKTIVYVDTFGQILETIRSTDKMIDQTVVGPIGHFSSYLIAY